MSKSKAKRLFEARALVTKLLADSDHKLLPDYRPEEDKTPWINYRAALRTIYSLTNADEIVWPVKPIVVE